MAEYKYFQDNQKGELAFVELDRYLKSAVYRQDDSYLYSLGYYLITARNGGWICEGFGTKAIVARHPHIENTYLVFPSLTDSIDKGLRLTLMILERFNYGQSDVLLMRFTKKQISRLNHLINTSQGTYSNYEFDHTVDPLLDGNYPVHILSTEKVSSLEGRDIKNVRSQHGKINSDDVEFVSLSDPRSLVFMKAILKYWEGNRIAYQENYMPDDGHYYEALFELLETTPQNFDGIITRYQGRLVGFTIWDYTGDDTANSLANLIDINTRGLPEYVTVEICRMLSDRGISYFNRGGSEDQGVDYFKRKFAPVKSLDLGIYKVTRQHIFHNIDISVLVTQKNNTPTIEPFVHYYEFC